MALKEERALEDRSKDRMVEITREAEAVNPNVRYRGQSGLSQRDLKESAYSQQRTFSYA